jgi:hypothetical protein
MGLLRIGLEGELDRARAADLVQRIQTACPYRKLDLDKKG